MHFPRYRVKLQHFGHATVFSVPRKFIPVDENVLVASYNSNSSEIMKLGGKRVSPDLQKNKKPKKVFHLWFITTNYDRGHIFCVIVCILPGNYSHQQVITAMGPHFAVGIGINHGPWG